MKMPVIEATAWYSENTVRSGSAPSAISRSDRPGRARPSPWMPAVSQMVG
jgi:hypothetical protein